MHFKNFKPFLFFISLTYFIVTKCGNLSLNILKFFLQKKKKKKKTLLFHFIFFQSQTLNFFTSSKKTLTYGLASVVQEIVSGIYTFLMWSSL